MTGKHLKIQEMGENVLGVCLDGDRRRPEPIHFRVCFPGGDVDVVRADDADGGDYWIHLRVNHPGDGWDPDRAFARICRARLDIIGPREGPPDVGDFDHEGLYHVALRVTRRLEDRVTPGAARGKTSR